MCEFHESTCNGFGDIWWTDNSIHFSSIDIVGGYYSHIICVLTKIRGLYSGYKPFIKTVVVACGYRLQAATEASANNVVGLLTSPAQNTSIISRIKLVVGLHCIALFT